MHEWSLAEGLIQALIDYAKNENLSKIGEIDISIGELMNIDVSVFEEALKSIMNVSGLSDTNINIVIERVMFKCKRCNYAWNISEVNDQLRERLGDLGIVEPEGKESPLHFFPELVSVFVNCPKCGSPDFQVISGNTIKVLKIIGERL